MKKIIVFFFILIFYSLSQSSERIDKIKITEQLTKEKRKCEIGALAPEFSVRSVQDPLKRLSLSSLKGKVVLLEFYMEMCGLCRHYLKKTQKLYDKYKSKGLAVICINVYEGNKNSSGYLPSSLFKLLKINLPNYIAEWDKSHKNFKQVIDYNIRAVPKIIIIDRNQKIRYIGRSISENLLKSYFNKIY